MSQKVPKSPSTLKISHPDSPSVTPSGARGLKSLPNNSTTVQTPSPLVLSPVEG